MTPDQLKNILEAALMTASGSMSLNQFVSLFEKDMDKPERADISAALKQLQEDYENRGVELKEVASGFRFQVRSEYSEWVNRLFDERPQRYSRALLETLAIIAYRQPITRGEIEDIRGVSISSSIIRTLQEREWIRVVGHRDVPGKPELLATSKQFLDYFNLKKLADLPSLAEIKDFDNINPDLFEGLEPEDNPLEDKLKDVQEIAQEPGVPAAVHGLPAGEIREIALVEDAAVEQEAGSGADTGTEDEKDNMDLPAQDNVVPFTS